MLRMTIGVSEVLGNNLLREKEEDVLSTGLTKGPCHHRGYCTRSRCMLDVLTVVRMLAYDLPNVSAVLEQLAMT